MSSNWTQLQEKWSGKKRKINDKGESVIVPSPALDLLVAKEEDVKIGKYIAMDCEMVGVGHRNESVLARVSLVNYNGGVLLDLYVSPKEKITDYRTKVSGITAKLLNDHGVAFEQAQQQVSDLIKDKILVGHAVQNDLSVLLLSHSKHDIRDTSRYKPLRKKYSKGKGLVGLRRLAEGELGIKIQDGSHDSVEDARCTMAIYRRVKSEWESIMTRVKRSKTQSQ